MDIPIIDVSPLVSDRANAQGVAAQIGQACRDNGFFYIVRHGVSSELQDRLENLSRQFFAQRKRGKENGTGSFSGDQKTGQARLIDHALFHPENEPVPFSTSGA